MKEIFEQVDGLKPYAFLIGSVGRAKDKKTGFVEKQVRRMQKKLPNNPIKKIEE